MSYESWQEEFYPKEASDIADATDEEVIEHSLQKWKGALPENCERHGVRYMHHEIVDFAITSTKLQFNAASCSLCQKYNDTNCKMTLQFESCPIVRLLGESCDGSVSSDESDYVCDPSVVGMFDAPYHSAFNNPRVMVDLLTKTLDFVKQGN